MRHRPRNPLISLLTLAAIAGALLAAAIPPAQAQTTYPGETDPIGNRPGGLTQFPDDELALVSDAPNDTFHRIEEYSPSPDYSLPAGTPSNVLPFPPSGSLTDPPGGYQRQFWVAKGRILDPTRDVAMALVKQKFEQLPGPSARITWALQEVSFSGASSPPPTVPSSTFSAPVPPNQPMAPNSPGALAVGDLDRAVDKDGVAHDEVVLAYENLPTGSITDTRVLLSVQDYAANPATATQTAAVDVQNGGNYGYPCNISWLYDKKGCTMNHPGAIDVALGDVDADGYQEIAVLSHVYNYKTNIMALNVALYDYCARGLATDDPRVVAGFCTANAATYSLSQRGNLAVDSSPYEAKNGSVFQGPAEIEAADLDGDGVEELAVTHLTNQRYISEDFEDDKYLGDVTLSVVAWAKAGGAKPALSVVWTSTSLREPIATVDAWYDGRGDSSDTPIHYHDVRLAAGLFKFSPVQGYTLARRQLAIAYSQDKDTLTIQLWDLASPASPMPSPPAKWTATGYEEAESSFCGDKYAAFGLVAGNWAGVKLSPANALWGLAVSYETKTDIQADLYRVDQNVNPQTAAGPLKLAASRTVDKYGTAANECGLTSRNELLAFDFDGDSIQLGPPAHMVVQIPQSFDYILEEPPQHLDYFPDGGWKNVSRIPEFNVSYTDTSSKSFATKTAKSTSWSVGVAAAANVNVGVNENLVVFGAKGSVSVSDQFNFDYSSNQQSYVGASDIYTTTLATATAGGDSLQLRTKVVDIWRYPVYGVKPSDITPSDPSLPYSYYELYLPRANNTPAQNMDDLTAQKYGYQPAHENGNLLSYPAVGAGESYAPPDQGPWLAPTSDKQPPGSSLCENNTRWCYDVPVSEADHQFNWGRTNSSLSLEIDSANTSGNSRDWTAKFGDTLGAEASVKTSFFGIGGSACLNTQLHGGGSWGKSSTSTFSSDESKALKINVPPSYDPTSTYWFNPLMYVTDSGVIKVGHAGGVDTSTGSFWSTNYDGPDWALSLPRKFNQPLGSTTWELNKNWLDAQEIRGFWVRSSKLNPVSNTYDVVDGVKLGQQVLLDARVYNYSVGTSVVSGTLPVRFDLEPFNPATNTYDPTKRFTAGTVTAPAIPFHGQTDQHTARVLDNYSSVRYQLDTSTLPAWPTGQLSQTYRVWVVLDADDPANAAGQTHGWRQSNVILTPLKTLSDGTVVSVQLLDAGGTNLGSVSYTSQSNDDNIAVGLMNALNKSPVMAQFGATANVQDTTTSTPSVVISKAGAQPPDSGEYRAGLVSGNLALYFVPTSVSPNGVPLLTATNLEYGQNNEGWGLLTVYKSAVPGRMLGGDDPCAISSGYSAQRAPDIRLGRGSLTAMPAQRRADGSKVVVRAGDRVPIRVSAFADIDWAGFERVSVFMGEPEDGGKVVGTALIRGITKARGGHDWFTWQAPTLPGTYTLVAQLDESWNDVRPGNNLASVEVIVEPGPRLPHRFWLGAVGKGPN